MTTKMTNGHAEPSLGTPLIIKASFGSGSSGSSSAGGSGSSGVTKRITFTDSRKVSYEVLKEKIGVCFSLSGSPFRMIYIDDDGDETEVSSDGDLSEAVAYFASDAVAESASQKSGSSAGSKVTMRLHVVLQYTGPSLSDAASTAEASSSWGGESGSKSRLGSWDAMSKSSRSDSDDRSSDYGPDGPQRGSFEGADHEWGGGPDGHRRGGRRCRGGRRRWHWHHFGGPPPPGSGGPYPSPSYGGPGPYGHHYPPPPPPPMGLGHGPPPWQMGPPPGPYPPPMPSSSGSSTSAYGSGGFVNGSRSLPVRAAVESHGNGSGSGSGAETVHRHNSDETARTSRRFSPPSTGRSSPTSSLASAPPRRVADRYQVPDLISDTTSQSEFDGPPSLVGGAQERGVSPRTERGYPPPSSPSSASTSELDTPSEGRAPSPLNIAAARQLDVSYAPPNRRGYDVASATSGWTSSVVSEDPQEMRDSALRRLQISSKVSVISRLSSAVPEELIRCCACREIMPSLRYICEVCGPIRPPSPMASDAGSTVDGDSSHVETTVNGLSIHDDEDDPPVKGLDRATDDAGSSVSGTRRGGVLDSSGYASSLDSGDRMLEDGTGSDSTPPTSADEEPLGFELCPTCVEHHGQSHAQAMVSARESGEDVRDQTVRHAFEEVMRDEDGGWREVEYEDTVHCTICGVGPLESNRFKCLSCARFDLCLSCYKRVHEIHPAHVFLAVPDKPVGPNHVASRSSNNQRLASWAHSLPVQVRPPSPRRHEGIVCFGCLGDIIGVRYSCSVCPSFDLCQRCEAANPAISSPDGNHTHTHIMLKIPVPVGEAQLADAQGRALELAHPASSSGPRSRGGSASAAISDGIGDFFRRQRPPPPWQHGFGPGGQGFHHGPFGGWHQPPPHFRGPPPPPSVFLINGLGGQAAPVSVQSLDPATLQQHLAAVAEHRVACNSCCRPITGNRWLCANCPTDPAYSLCSDCERGAHLHDPMHAFIRIIYPLQKGLPRTHALIPIIYAPPALARRSDSNGNEVELGTFHEANSVAHSNVICDLCLEPIRGAWFRCANCSDSYDICGDCAVNKPPNPQHDARHVWVKFVRRVDMSLFKDLVQLSTPTPRPLIAFSLYD